MTHSTQAQAPQGEGQEDPTLLVVHTHGSECRACLTPKWFSALYKWRGGQLVGKVSPLSAGRTINELEVAICGVQWGRQSPRPGPWGMSVELVNESWEV